MKKQREFDEARRDLAVTIETKVQESLEAVRVKALATAEQTLGKRLAKKDTQLASMQRQSEDLKRKAEQGAQQVQGEALEGALESTLRARFPHDLIEEEPKGEFGGDILQRVVGPAHQVCGTILWKTNQTRNWSDGWLAKLREDQRTAKAEIALIVSSALPKEVTAFDLVDGIWVVQPRCAVPVVIALHYSLRRFMEIQCRRLTSRLRSN